MNTLCKACNGKGLLKVKVKNLATLEYRESVDSCHVCNFKGYVTSEDKKRVHNVINSYEPYYESYLGDKIDV